MDKVSQAMSSANKTSARFLVEVAEVMYLKDQDGRHDPKRYFLMFDLYIKARSAAILNKIFFWVSFFFGVLVLVWPSVAVFTKEFALYLKFVESAIVQTSITAVAALSFAFYSHYKKYQNVIENLMRFTLYSEIGTENLIEQVTDEMAKIDSGFSFRSGISPPPE